MTNPKPDRNVTFRGIDGDGNARRLVRMLLRELLEEQDDREALALLHRVEAESC